MMRWVRTMILLLARRHNDACDIIGVCEPGSGGVGGEVGHCAVTADGQNAALGDDPLDVTDLALCDAGVYHNRLKGVAVVRCICFYRAACGGLDGDACRKGRCRVSRKISCRGKDLYALVEEGNALKTGTTVEGRRNVVTEGG